MRREQVRIAGGGPPQGCGNCRKFSFPQSCGKFLEKPFNSPVNTFSALPAQIPAVREESAARFRTASHPDAQKRLNNRPYIYLVGAVAVAAMQLKDGYGGANVVIRRLRRQQLIGAALLIMAGVLMIVWHRNEWVLCLTISAVLQLYTAFRIPQEEEKEKRKNG